MSRIIPHPPNFTPILASAIMAPILIKDRMFGIAIPIFAMFLSDIILGFHSYQFIVYFSILMISLLTPITKNYISLFIIAITSSIWFYLVTNFAVWIIWDYYPKNIEGLISCYILAIPFFKNTLLSACIFTCLIAFLSNHIENVNKKTINMISKIIQ